MKTRVDTVSLEKDVVDLLETYFEKVVFPLDPMKLARMMGIKLIAYGSMTTTDHLLSQAASPDAFTAIDDTDLKAVICYKEDVRPISRLPFTISHEIAHVWLGHDEGDNPIYEAEADYFAGYLLAPHPLILNYGLTPSHIQRYMHVSAQCAQFAYDQSMHRLFDGSIWRPYEIKLLNECRIDTIPQAIRPIGVLRRKNRPDSIKELFSQSPKEDGIMLYAS